MINIYIEVIIFVFEIYEDNIPIYFYSRSRICRSGGILDHGAGIPFIDW